MPPRPYINGKQVPPPQKPTDLPEDLGMRVLAYLIEMSERGDDQAKQLVRELLDE